LIVTVIDYEDYFSVFYILILKNINFLLNNLIKQWF